MQAAKELAGNKDLFGNFDYANALKDLQEDLLCKGLSPQKCSRHYAGIYTKVLFIEASLEKAKSEKKYNPRTHCYYDENLSWEDATIIAAKKLSNLIIPPETRMPIQEKLQQSLIRLKLKS